MTALGSVQASSCRSTTVRSSYATPSPSYDDFNGPPNFVLDVFPGDDLLDYEHRRECFERAEVIEYVAVRLTEPLEWIWNRLIDGKFSEIKTADNELIMSTALPGLWIPSYALKHRDWWAIMGAIARGVSRVGHHEFMDTIWKVARPDAGGNPRRSTTTKADGWGGWQRHATGSPRSAAPYLIVDGGFRKAERPVTRIKRPPPARLRCRQPGPWVWLSRVGWHALTTGRA